MSLQSVAPAPRLAPRTSIGPNWFASVMGTGIVAVVLAPTFPGVALAFWIVAASLLGVLTVVYVVQERSYVDHPVQVHFYGAPAMAALTVGAGAVLTQGATTAILLLDAVLWTAGTALGVATALAVPRLTRGTPLDAVGAWWLMPVVPPTVSATTGALLVPHVPAGAPRTAFLLLCYALLILSLVGTARVVRLLIRRVRLYGLGEAATLPTWFMVLGPLGQSVTAVHHLGQWAPGSVRTFTPVYGYPILVLALVLLISATVVVARTRAPFGLAWWSFTFPVGTVVTGSAALGFEAVAAVLTAALVVAWSVAAAGTLRGARDGSLLRA